MPLALHVWVPLPVPGFDYLAPHDPPADTDTGDPDGVETLVGARIAVPWQGGVRVGIVAAARAVGGAAALDLRPAVAWVDARSWLHAPARSMLAAQAARCVVPIGVALAGAGVLGLKGPFEHHVRRDAQAPADLLGPEAAQLRSDAWLDADELPVEALDVWRTHGLVHERVRTVRETARRLVPVRAADAALAGAAREAQRRALAWLEDRGEVDSAAALARAADVPLGAARGLVAKGYAAYEERPLPEPAPPWATAGAGPFSGVADAAGRGSDPTPAGGSRLVTGGLAVDRFAAVVASVRAWVSAGEQVLWLVPEQAGGDALATALACVVPTLRWPSDGDDARRVALADEIARGTPAVVVGTYPALAVPFARLSHVVVWDAASGSYKGLAGARSVARVDALVLARAAGAGWTSVDPLATAELRAEAADEVVALPRPRPRAALIDLRTEPGWPLSAPLVRLLRQVAERRRQALLLVPRRGFAAALGCRTCGAVVACPNCDVPLRWYARAARLRCHRCGLERGAPVACPDCGAPGLVPRPGAGTEWVVDTVRAAIADLDVWQWDRDRRDDLGPMTDGAPGVVVGTLALLRAPPLPALALVALTSGDALLDHEDVRATESALRTLLQLSDLATGVRRPLLVAQVHRPEHEVWTAWTSPDLDDAVEGVGRAIAGRRAAFGYPPCRRWARVQVTHRDVGQAAAAAAAVADRLKAAGVPAVDVLGPAPAPMARARGRYAFHVFVRADDDATLAERVQRVDPRPGAGARVRVDVDPYDVEAWLD